jgi:DNA replication protein DnaC
MITARAPGLTAKADVDLRMRVYLVPKVLIIDEMGYLVLDDLGATIFFQ